jgi:hypothetical protein
MDYLVVFALLLLVVLANKQIVDAGMTATVLKGIILMYGCEVVMKKMSNRWNAFTVSALTALLVIAVRGVL